MRFSSAQTKVTKKEQERGDPANEKNDHGFCIIKTKSDIFNELVLYLSYFKDILCKHLKMRGKYVLVQ